MGLYVKVPLSSTILYFGAPLCSCDAHGMRSVERKKHVVIARLHGHGTSQEYTGPPSYCTAFPASPSSTHRPKGFPPFDLQRDRQASAHIQQHAPRREPIPCPLLIRDVLKQVWTPLEGRHPQEPVRKV